MRFWYKFNTVMIIFILGLFLSVFSYNLKESESIFDKLESKQKGLGFIPPIMFFGFLSFRKRKAKSISED